jgi:hypothetical protein
MKSRALPILRFILVPAALCLAVDAQRDAWGQPFCAVYDTGTKSCGIPSLQSCQQSLSGVGGVCSPDLTSEMRPDFFQSPRPFLPQPSPPQAGSSDLPGTPNWMPPPPQQ